jgi:hypothetical protein
MFLICLAYMTSKALRRLHIPTATIKLRGKSRFPAARDRAPEPNTIRWKGVRDLSISLDCGAGRMDVHATGFCGWVFPHLACYFFEVEFVD